MAIREHRCSKGTVTEDIYLQEDGPETIICPCCNTSAKLMISNIARTRGNWGATGVGGTEATPFYDRGLGASYTSWSERAKIMKAKGLQDYDEAACEKQLSKQHTHEHKENVYCDTYEHHIKQGAEPITAMQLATEAKEEAN